MKKLLLLLAACVLMATGCKGGTSKAAQENVTEPAETAIEPAFTTEFSFDELFRIFSCFGDNIMTKAYAAQSTKDGIKDELANEFKGRREFTGETNSLSHSFNNDGCSEDFQMSCYRYSADRHVLVMLLESGGCDVTSIKYLRAYEYDPDTNSAHEVQLPFNPAPKRDDFEDMVRLAGADVASLRDAMNQGDYLYEFHADNVKVRLNDPMDYDEEVYNGDLVVNYWWNGSEFLREKGYRYACIHANGFASIILGEPAPNFHFDYDPLGYGVTYSQGGDLWLINLGEEETLQVQMENGKVYSIETRSPRYRVSAIAYDGGEGKVQPYVGACINDCITFGSDADAPVVKMLMDGTISIEVSSWNSIIAFRTSQDALATPTEPSDNGPVIINNPKFKNDARIESIIVWREQ